MRLSGAVALLALAGLADALLARRRHRRRLMMTREEVRREWREAEGDPWIRRRRRQLHRQLAEGGTARGVGAATTVVVNPTHLAVALRYAPREAPAPYLVAKARAGEALTLQRQARALGVPVVRDVALARSLILLGVGEEIPEELYEAAAAVLQAVTTVADPAVSDGGDVR
jgi:type III secretion protein U